MASSSNSTISNSSPVFPTCSSTNPRCYVYVPPTSNVPPYPDGPIPQAAPVTPCGKACADKDCDICLEVGTEDVTLYQLNLRSIFDAASTPLTASTKKVCFKIKGNVGASNQNTNPAIDVGDWTNNPAGLMYMKIGLEVGPLKGDGCNPTNGVIAGAGGVFCGNTNGLIGATTAIRIRNGTQLEIVNNGAIGGGGATGADNPNDCGEGGGGAGIPPGQSNGGGNYPICCGGEDAGQILCGGNGAGGSNKGGGLGENGGHIENNHPKPGCALEIEGNAVYTIRGNGFAGEGRICGNITTTTTTPAPSSSLVSSSSNSLVSSSSSSNSLVSSSSSRSSFTTTTTTTTTPAPTTTTTTTTPAPPIANSRYPAIFVNDDGGPLEGWYWEQANKREGRYNWKGPKRRADLGAAYDVGNNTNNGLIYYYKTIFYEAWRLDLPGPNPGSAPRLMTYGNANGTLSCGSTQVDPNKYPMFCSKSTWKRWDNGTIAGPATPECVQYVAGQELTSFMCPAVYNQNGTASSLVNVNGIRTEDLKNL
jgi:hypothetical protein